MIENIMTIMTLAQTEEDTVTQQLNPSMADLFLRTVISLAVILILTWLVLRVIKKQQDMRMRLQNSQKGWIRIHDYQSLAPNRGIYLMELFSRVYVVGSSEHSINILQEVEPDNEEWLAYKDNLENMPEILPAGLTSLKNKLRTFKNKKEKTFKQELSDKLEAEVNDQLDRTHRLYRNTVRGDNDGL